MHVFRQMWQEVNRTLPSLLDRRTSSRRVEKGKEPEDSVFKVLEFGRLDTNRLEDVESLARTY
jgi:hypothetical protein